MSNSLWPHELQHARLPCPSPTPRVHPNSCPSSRWCHPAISRSVVPFSSCPQSLPPSESFPMSQLFTSCGQSIGVSASTSVHPGLISFRMDWLDLLAVYFTTIRQTVHFCSLYHFFPSWLMAKLTFDFYWLQNLINEQSFTFSFKVNRLEIQNFYPCCSYISHNYLML